MTAVALRRRFEALARHPSAEVRCAAFRILVLDDPAPGTASEMESFLDSGLPFLSAESVETIAQAGLPGERLAVLRRRLHGYRTRLPRPLPPMQADLLSDVFNLLVRHIRRHREDYVAVRSELAWWALEETNSRVARTAASLLDELSEWYQEGLPSRASSRGLSLPRGARLRGARADRAALRRDGVSGGISGARLRRDGDAGRPRPGGDLDRTRRAGQTAPALPRRHQHEIRPASRPAPHRRRRPRPSGRPPDEALDGGTRFSGAGRARGAGLRLLPAEARRPLGRAG